MDAKIINSHAGGKWIDSLQALRALAFLGIFTSHAQLNSQLGAWGVSVFFVLSGFLMVYRYYGNEIDKGVINSVLFSYNKIKKLYVLHIVMMIVATPFEIKRTGIEFSSIAIYTWIGRIISNVLLSIPVAGYRQSGEMETVVPAFWKPSFR